MIVIMRFWVGFVACGLFYWLGCMFKGFACVYACAVLIECIHIVIV